MNAIEVILNYDERKLLESSLTISFITEENITSADQYNIFQILEWLKKDYSLNVLENGKYYIVYNRCGDAIAKIPIPEDQEKSRYQITKAIINVLVSPKVYLDDWRKIFTMSLNGLRETPEIVRQVIQILLRPEYFKISSESFQRALTWATKTLEMECIQVIQGDKDGLIMVDKKFTEIYREIPMRIGWEQRFLGVI